MAASGKDSTPAIYAAAISPWLCPIVMLGAMVSWTVAYRLSVRDHPARAARAAAPWTALVAGLAAVAIWVLSQPMEMRGTFFG